MELEEYLNVKQKLLEAQIEALRSLKQQLAPARTKKMTQIEMVVDILNDAGHDLHIQKIITGIKKKHGVELDRETIVSSIAKKISKGTIFKRVAPNTYDLILR